MGLSDQLKSSGARTPALVLAILLVLAVGLAVVAAGQDRGPDTVTVVRASPFASSTTSTTTPAVVDPSATTTTAAPNAAVPTVAQPPGPGSPAPTAPPPGPDPVVTQPAPTTPPPSNETPQCTSAQADQTLATDKATYSASEPVNVTATVRNHSATTCAVANPDSNCYLLFVALAANGAEAWRSGPALTGSCSPLPRRTLFPGAVVTYSATWNQLNLVGARVPGLYTIQSRWLAGPKSAVLELLP